MKRILFCVALCVLALSCTKEDLTVQDFQTETRGVKVDVCHYDADNDSWHVINVNINSLPAHQGHGDAVDMDGDGYFDIDNGCGPTDCDDTDATLTDNCCPADCGWCEDIDLFDFGPTCYDENGDWTGGTYGCFYTYTYDYGDDYNCDGCPYNYTAHTGYIYDYNYYADCDEEDDNTQNYIYIYAQTYTYCCEDYFYSDFYYYSYDNDTGQYVVDPEYGYEQTQEAYDLALLCIDALEEYATNNDIPDQCEDYNYDYDPLTTGTSDTNLKTQDESEMPHMLNMPDLREDSKLSGPNSTPNLPKQLQELLSKKK